MRAELYDLICELPKVELHRHFEGAIPIETLLAIGAEIGHPYTQDFESLRPHVQMIPLQPYTAEMFLSKFKVLRQFFVSQDAIWRMVSDVAAAAAADNIFYMELRFTPRALNNQLNVTYDEVIELVSAAAYEAEARYRLLIRLIVSVNRHESLEICEEVLNATLRVQCSNVVGFDLAGAEYNHSCLPFAPYFQKAKAHGYAITVHAGEWSGAESVRDAIQHLGASRIGHGVRILEDDAVLNLCLEQGVVLEVCPTSNLHSGIITSLESHPLAELYALGVHTTINTDDPLVSDITLSDEYLRGAQAMDFEMDDLHQHVLTALDASFLQPEERVMLRKQFLHWLATTGKARG